MAVVHLELEEDEGLIDAHKEAGCDWFYSHDFAISTCITILLCGLEICPLENFVAGHWTLLSIFSYKTFFKTATNFQITWAILQLACCVLRLQSCQIWVFVLISLH